MPHVACDVVIGNLMDVFDVREGCRAAGQVRGVVTGRVLVETDRLPPAPSGALVRRLGLTPVHRPRRREVVYDPVWSTVTGQSRTMGVTRSDDDGAPVVLGRLVLLAPDLDPDPTGQRLTSHPVYNGGYRYERS